MSEPTLLLAGAGYTGRRLLARLPAEVAIALSRSAQQGVRQRLIIADLDRESPALPPVQTVIYTVPPAREATPDRRLQHLLDGLRVMPQRFVYFSTSGVYGDCGGERVDETATPRPLTARAGRRLAAEQCLQAWSRSNDVELCILRVPGIYGPDRIRLSSLANGDAILREADAPPGNRIHVEDLVTCALAASDRSRPAGIYNVGDGDHRSSSWFVRTVAELAGLPAPRELSLAEAKHEFSAKRLSFLGESRRLDVRRMHDRLGVQLAYGDARDGIRASLPG